MDHQQVPSFDQKANGRSSRRCSSPPVDTPSAATHRRTSIGRRSTIQRPCKVNETARNAAVTIDTSDGKQNLISGVAGVAESTQGK